MLGFVRNGRVLLGAVIVLALVAVAVWPRTTEVETAGLSRGPLVVTIDEDGRTRVRDRFVLTSPVAGELLRVALKPGDAVVKGKTTLAVVRAAAPAPLDARSRAEADAAVRSAEAAVGRVTAERQRAATVVGPAKDRLRRTAALAQAGAVAKEALEAQQAELDAAEESLRAAEFAVAQAAQELEVARARVSTPAADGAQREWVLVAPVDGVVLARHHESQSVVPPGEPILEVGDVRHIEIVADLLSADAVRVRPGSDVIIDQWGGADLLRGRVQRIEPAGFTKISALGVEEQRVNAIVEFDQGTTQPLLGDNYRVEVRIVVWKADAVLRVPPAALFRRGDDWAVFVVEDGRARERRVKIGQRNAEAAEVLDGLTERDTVITYPPDTLVDGGRVAQRHAAQ